MTYRSANCIVTLTEIQNAINEKNSVADKTMKAITVKMVDLNWILAEEGSGFLHLCQILNSAETQSILVTDFVNYILQEFWDEYFYKLFF